MIDAFNAGYPAIALIALGLSLLALAHLLPKKPPCRIRPDEPVTSASDVPLTHALDEPLPSSLPSLPAPPTVLGHIVASTKARARINEDRKTMEQHTACLRANLQNLRVRKEFRAEVNGLRLLESHDQIQALEVATQKHTLENTLRDQQELADASRENKKIELQLARTRMQKEIRDLEKEPQPPEAAKEKLSPEQRRQRVLHEAHDLQSEMERVLMQISLGHEFEDLAVEDQERYDRVRNTYENLIERKLEELERT